MDYIEFKDREGKRLYISLDKNEISTDFDTDLTRAEIRYHDSVPNGDIGLFSIILKLSEEFIEDTYHTTGPISDSMKNRACLDIGARAYEERQARLRNIETIIATAANSRLRYIPRIDMQPIKPN